MLSQFLVIFLHKVRMKIKILLSIFLVILYSPTIEGTPEGGISGNSGDMPIVLQIIVPLIVGFSIAGLSCLFYRCVCKHWCEQRAANEMLRLRMLAQPIVCENCGHEMTIA